jgi:hypothetical protein
LLHKSTCLKLSWYVMLDSTSTVQIALYAQQVRIY